MGELPHPDNPSNPDMHPSPSSRSILIDAEIVAHFASVPTDVPHLFLSLLSSDSFTRSVFSSRSPKDLERVIESLKQCLPTSSELPIPSNHGRTDSLKHILSAAENFAAKEKFSNYEPQHILKAIISQTPVNYYVHLAVSRNMDMKRLPNDFARRERRERK